MPRPALRTRSKKRRRLGVPGGRKKTHYRREKAVFSSCSMCGKELPGVPRLTPTGIRKLPPSQRRPERIYGGQLCSGCLRDRIKHMVRST